MATGERKQKETRDPLLEAVGGRIRTLREERKIAPADFARAAGFSLQYLWRLQDGQQNLSLRSISRVAIALGVPMSALFEGIDPDPDTIGTRPYRQGDKAEQPNSKDKRDYD